MHLSSLWQILYIFSLYQLNVGLNLVNSSSGTNVTRWSEDDWLETRFLIDTKFMFHRQRYEHVILRTRMNEWSFELSYGNRSNQNKIWTEFHLFFDRRQSSNSLNNSINGHVRHYCHPPIVSPLTNDSNTAIPELTEMDKRIADYFVSDGFFRTINYINCTIDERRREPPIHIQIKIYLVTNRQFQSLLYIEMSNATRNSFLEHQARFYLHNNEQNFKYNFNITNIDYRLSTNTSYIHMLKLYNQIKQSSSISVIMTANNRLYLFNFVVFWIFFAFFK
jgi:hypothetical protein